MSKVVVLGDIILDKFSYGTTDKLSHEAPAPIILVSEERYFLGGGGKTAEILKQLNNDVHLIGTIGENYHGKRVKSLLDEQNIKHFLLTMPMKTIVKNRFIVQGFNQQIMRADFEDNIHIEKKQEKQILDYIYEVNPDYIIISDYALGAITFNLIKTLKEKFKLFVHSKPSHMAFYKDVYLIKPVCKELKYILSKYEVINCIDVLADISKLFNTNVLLNHNDGIAKFYSKDKKKLLDSKIEIPEVKNHMLWIEDYILGAFSHFLIEEDDFAKSIKLASKEVSKIKYYQDYLF